MTKIRQWSLLTVGIIVVVFLAGWFLAISPQQSHAASLRKQQAAQDVANQGLQTTLARLTAQSDNVVANQARLAAIAKELPATADLAIYVRSLTAAAAATNIDLVSIAPSTPTTLGPIKTATPVTPVTPAVPSAAVGGKAAPAAATTSPSAAPGGTAVPARTGATGTTAPQTGLQAVSLTIVANGDYFALEQFLTKLQTMQRTTIVSSVNLTPAAPLLAPGAAAPAPALNNAWKTIGANITVTIFEAAMPAIAAPAAPLATPAAAAHPSAATN